MAEQSKALAAKHGLDDSLGFGLKRVLEKVENAPIFNPIVKSPAFQHTAQQVALLDSEKKRAKTAAIRAKAARIRAEFLTWSLEDQRLFIAELTDDPEGGWRKLFQLAHAALEDMANKGTCPTSAVKQFAKDFHRRGDLDRAAKRYLNALENEEAITVNRAALSELMTKYPALPSSSSDACLTLGPISEPKAKQLPKGKKGGSNGRAK